MVMQMDIRAHDAGYLENHKFQARFHHSYARQKAPLSVSARNADPVFLQGISRILLEFHHLRHKYQDSETLFIFFHLRQYANFNLRGSVILVYLDGNIALKGYSFTL